MPGNFTAGSDVEKTPTCRCGGELAVAKWRGEGMLAFCVRCRQKPADCTCAKVTDAAI